ncbi:MAG: CPBP family intramembrane metalloprotease [Bacteroides sp.]|nr:CPBP family intramembrane metalloprotease [Bacteroides sp.]
MIPQANNLRFSPGGRIVILVVSLCLFTIIGSILIGLVTRGGYTTQTLRVSTVLQDCIIFIVPAIVSAILISQYPANFLGINRGFKIEEFLWAVVALLFSIPAMNALVELNESMTLPESLSGIEQMMRDAEQRAQDSVDILLGNHTIGSLIVNILIVGILAGFSEEILFRGALQRILLSCRLNCHVAIWLTAFLFSAFHLQFFGFFPRLLLGGYFGYLFYWSRSLWLPAALHAFNNSLVVYTMWQTQNSGDEYREIGETINTWGAHSPWLILISIFLTAIIIVRLHKITSINPITTPKV